MNRKQIQQMLLTDTFLVGLKDAKTQLLSRTMPSSIILGDNGVRYEYAEETKNLLAKVDGYIEERTKQITSMFNPRAEAER
jgi:hypothetical protein